MVPKINDYQEEIHYIYKFFENYNIDIHSIPVIFWNHIVTLFERIEKNEQNEMHLDQSVQMSDDAQKFTKEFVEYLNGYTRFSISNFEFYLLTVYFEQIKEGRNDNE